MHNSKKIGYLKLEKGKLFNEKFGQEFRIYCKNMSSIQDWVKLFMTMTPLFTHCGRRGQEGGPTCGKGSPGGEPVRHQHTGRHVE